MPWQGKEPLETMAVLDNVGGVVGGDLFPRGTHLVPNTSSKQRFHDVQNVDSEDVHKT